MYGPTQHALWQVQKHSCTWACVKHSIASHRTHGCKGNWHQGGKAWAPVTLAGWLSMYSWKSKGSAPAPASSCSMQHRLLTVNKWPLNVMWRLSVIIQHSIADSESLAIQCMLPFSVFIQRDPDESGYAWQWVGRDMPGNLSCSEICLFTVWCMAYGQACNKVCIVLAHDMVLLKVDVHDNEQAESWSCHKSCCFRMDAVICKTMHGKLCTQTVFNPKLHEGGSKLWWHVLCKPEEEWSLWQCPVSTKKIEWQWHQCCQCQSSRAGEQCWGQL